MSTRSVIVAHSVNEEQCFPWVSDKIGSLTRIAAVGAPSLGFCVKPNTAVVCYIHVLIPGTLLLCCVCLALVHYDPLTILGSTRQ